MGAWQDELRDSLGISMPLVLNLSRLQQSVAGVIRGSFIWKGTLDLMANGQHQG